MISWAKRIGEAYNKTFVNNWEYYPLTDNEIKFALDNIITVVDPKLLKIITHNDDVVGFLIAFPDVSAALQRANGNLNPLSLADLLLEMKRTKWVSLNGAGVLPEYHGRGGNALLYYEMEKTIDGFQLRARRANPGRRDHRPDAQGPHQCRRYSCEEPPGLPAVDLIRAVEK